MKQSKLSIGKLSLFSLITITLFLLALSLASCSNSDNDRIDTIIPPSALQFANLRAESLGKITQYFEFNADDGHISLITANGVEILIDAYCLSKNGNPVNGMVALEYVEIFEKGNMITTNKPTMGYLPNGDKALLLTGGEFFFEATQDEVQLDMHCPITIIVPTSLTGGSDPEMIMWNGIIDDDGDLTWEEEGFGCDGDCDERKGIFVQDEKYYALVQNFGWTNIDRFYNDPRPKTTLKVQPPAGYNYQNSAVYLSYDGEATGLAQLDTFDDGVFSEHYGQIPIGLDCHLLFITEDNGLWRYSIKSVTIAENQIYTFTIEETIAATEAELITIVNGLP